MIYFAETLRHGKWWPCLIHGERPETEKRGGKLRLRSYSGLGDIIRSEPVEVNAGLRWRSLSEIAEVYGQDGKFRFQSGRK